MTNILHLVLSSRLFKGVVICLALVGCTSNIDVKALNRGSIQAPESQVRLASTNSNILIEDSVALSFSGGGARAAAFSLGVLKGLDGLHIEKNDDLIDHVRFITAVSGGSMTAAYFGLNGKAGLDTFRNVALLGDSEVNFRFNLLNPSNVWRLLSGGLNDRNSFQTWLDKNVFLGAKFAQMKDPKRPTVWINATNLRQRIAFPFHERTFEAICSDFPSFPISEAVAASMAVPLVFAPVILEKHPENCKEPIPDWLFGYGLLLDESMLSKELLDAISDFRDINTGRYVKLVDGGLSDNFGLLAIRQSRLLMGTPGAPWSKNDMIKLRNLLFIVVDSGQQPSITLNKEPLGTGAVDLALAAIDAAIDANARLSYDSFSILINRWQDEIIRYRCGLNQFDVEDIRKTQPSWQCEKINLSLMYVSLRDYDSKHETTLNTIPTRLKLPQSDVDALINAGHDSVAAHPAVMQFIHRIQAANEHQK